MSYGRRACISDDCTVVVYQANMTLTLIPDRKYYGV